MGIRQRSVRLVARLAMVLVGAATLLTADGGSAGAAVTVTCSVSVQTLDVQIAGGISSDLLMVTPGSGFWTMTLDGNPACTGTPYPVGPTGVTAVDVTETTPTPVVPVVFDIDAVTGIDVVGPVGGQTTVSLGNVTATSIVNVNGGQMVIGTGTAAFANATTIVGSSNGSTRFVVNGTGGTGGVNLIGQGPPASNILDTSGLSLPVTVDYSLTPQPRLTFGTQYDTFLGGSIGSFVGSPLGTHVIVGSSGPYDFSVPGGGSSTDVFDLSQAPGPVTVDLTGSLGLVTHAGVSDTVTGFGTFIGSNQGTNTFKANRFGGYTFQGRQTTGDLLDLSGAGSGLELTRAMSCAQPGTVSGLEPGLGGLTFDHFCQLRPIGFTRTIGYRLFSADGGIYSYNEPFFGSAPGLGIRDLGFVGAARAANGGYYEVDSQGAVFAFGGAHFYGSCLQPRSGCSGLDDIIGIATYRHGLGYWLVNRFGDVYSFNAPFRGSLGSLKVSVNDIVAVAPYGDGYALLGKDGGFFNFSDGMFEGSCPSVGSGCRGAKNFVGFVTIGRRGYDMVASDGGVFGFNAKYYGSCPQTGSICRGVTDIVAMYAPGCGGGYYLERADGIVYPFGDVPNLGPTIAPRQIQISFKGMF